MKMKTIAFVLGTRAEAIKMLPIIAVLDARRLDYKVISTGQHDLSEFRLRNFEQLQAPKGKSGAFAGPAGAVWFVIRNIIKLRRRLAGSIVIVQGDTMSTLAGAVAGRLAGSPVCHVESGLRTGDYFQPFPEELSRVVTDRVSQLHFAPTAKYAANTPPESTFVVGNTVIDPIAKRNLKISDNGEVIVSIHRQENINSRRVMAKLVEEIEKIAGKRKVLFVIHDNTRRRLAEYGLLGRVENCCHTLPLLAYEDFIARLAKCHAVLSDSGGLAEECSYLGKPLAIFRNKTERMEAVEAGNAILGLDSDLLSFVEGFKCKDRFIYGDGTASEKIVEIIVEKLGDARK